MVQFPLGHATAGSGGGGAGSVTVKSMWPARGSIVVVGPNPAPLPLTVSPVVNDLVIVRSPTMCAPGFCANAGEATSMDIRSARTVTVIRLIQVIFLLQERGFPRLATGVRHGLLVKALGWSGPCLARWWRRPAGKQCEQAIRHCGPGWRRLAVTVGHR